MSGDLVALAALVVTPALVVLAVLAGLGLVLAGLADPESDGRLLRPRNEARRP